MNLNYKSLQFLRECLMSTGWNGRESDGAQLKRKRAYTASKLLDEVLPFVPDVELPPSKKTIEDTPQSLRDYNKRTETFYASACADFTLTEIQFDCIQVCLGHCIDNDMIPKGGPLKVLQETFKLIPE